MLPRDLEAYLHRIGLTEPVAPTLATLRAIHALHPQAIAFENLNPLLGLPVALDAAALQAKLVGSARGGYCFEHNLLLAAALEAIGFPVTKLAARVLWGQPDDAVTPRSHMLLAVDAEGERYLVDVGFGGQVLTGPLRLAPGEVQTTPHEPFRIIATGDHLRLQTALDDGWRTLYRFDLAPQYDVDYAVTNYYLSTHPASHFVTGLVAARTEPGRRYALRGQRLAIHTVGDATQTRMLTSGDEIRSVLRDTFRVEVPATPRTAEILDRVAAGAVVR